MCPNKYQSCFAQACCYSLIIFAFLISRSILDFQFFSNQFVFSNPILTNPVKCCSKNETPWQHFPKTFGPTHGQGRLWSHHNSRPPFQGKPRIFRLRCWQPQSLALSHPVHPRMRKLNNFRLCFAISRNLTRLNFLFSFARAFIVDDDRQNEGERKHCLQTDGQSDVHGRLQSNYHCRPVAERDPGIFWLPCR